MPASSGFSAPPWELLARHVAGELSAAEQAALQNWVQADPRHQRLLTAVTRAWARTGEVAAAPAPFVPADVAAAWQRLQPLLGPLPVPLAGPGARSPGGLARLGGCRAGWLPPPRWR